ncbi:MAG: Lnb N-terminal periplasmic domain-containing protein [Aureliella sp.]
MARCAPALLPPELHCSVRFETAGKSFWRCARWLVIVLAACGCRLVTPPAASDPPPLSEEAAAAPKRKTIAAILASSAGRKEPDKPSNFRNWRPDLAVLPVADISGDRIKLYHIRDCTYRTEEDYDVRYFDREFVLSDVRSVDFIVVPFQNAPALAHTMLSFGMANGEHFVVSVEGRMEQGETYSTLGGAMNGYELMVVVGTERDLILLRTEVRKVDVYLYPTRVPPEQVQRLFVAMLGRANELARKPEFYDLLTNNCTTNIVSHINALKPGYIPNDVRVLLPGHSDRLAYDLGLLAVEGPFEQIKASCHINLAAHLNYDAPDFSARIRQR